MNGEEKKVLSPIKQWADDDKPREKLMIKGARSLSNAELLAILIGSGYKEISAVELSRQIMNKNSNSFTQLARKSYKELQKIKGLGPAKSVAVVAAMELARRQRSENQEEKTIIKSSKDAYKVARKHVEGLEYEEFWMILLDRSNQVTDCIPVSMGGVSRTIVDPRIIFKHAISSLASCIVLFHNHPSGQLKPSKDDLEITEKIKNGGKLLDILLLDHLIITDSKYVSFADKGWL